MDWDSNIEKAIPVSIKRVELIKDGLRRSFVKLKMAGGYMKVNITGVTII